MTAFQKFEAGLRARCAAGWRVVLVAIVLAPCGSALAQNPGWSVARIWNEQLLEAIRNDSARPPIHARNLYHVSAAMFDAWSVYDEHAIGVFNGEKVTADDVEAARHEAISYAAYRVMNHRFANSIGADVILPAIEEQMWILGYNPEITTTVGNSPAAIGNRCAYTILIHGLSDGSYEGLNYLDPFYEPLNESLVLELPGNPNLVHPNNWQEIWLNVQIGQTGEVFDGNTVPFVGPHWGFVTPFALTEEHATPDKPGVYLDPGTPPMLGESPEDDAAWIENFVEVVVTASILDPDLDLFIDISPANFGNNPLGSNENPGHGPTNPVTGETYEPNVVRYGDYGRVIAEFWADGPMSSTPPGHWNEMANEFVADNPVFEHRIGGTGPILDRLEWDVKMHLAINGAAHDAAVACWGVKGFYDWVRPVMAIRYMADRGQSSDPSLPSYHPHGLPLIDDLIELITEESAAPGGKHFHLAEMVVDEFGLPVIKDGDFVWDHFIGEVAVIGWPGAPNADPDDNTAPVSYPNAWVNPKFHNLDATYSGVQWIRGRRWSTYQEDTFITPPFAGYTSGHTTYSRAIAEVLTALTGTHYFPGGLAEYHIPQGWLHFEFGPSEDMVLQWTTFYDAADQSARSRIYGGIHPPIDDIPARFHGHEIGLIVADKALYHFGSPDQPRPCPEDLTGSGTVDVFDLLQLLSAWGACPRQGSCPADLNGDGTVDVFDLLQLLAAWGPCP